MTLADRRARLEMLRPRDRDVVRALLENSHADEVEVAEIIGMSVHTLKHRLKFIYPTLDVHSRVHLHGAYLFLVLGCGCASLE